MPLTFVASITSVTADLNQGIVSDATVYGGSNPARNTLALYLLLYKRDVNSVDTQITIDNSQPLTAVQWTFALPIPDGLFVGIFIGASIWSAGTYATNSVVYYSGSVYQANTSTSQTPGGGNWTLVTDIATLIGNSNVQQSQVYMFSAARAQAGPLGDALQDLGPRIVNGVCKSWADAAAAITGGSLIESAWSNFRRADYINAQSIMDFVDAQTSLTI